MSSRRSIASVVCPSAPFLVPRGARVAFQNVQRRIPAFTASKHGAASRRPAQASAFLSKTKAQRSRPAAPVVLDERSAELLAAFRATVSAGDIHTVLRQYPSMVATGLLNHNDSLHIARLIHNTHRRSQSPLCIVLTDQLTEDLRKGAIPPHYGASLHLLSFLKEAEEYEKGFELWSWLARKNNDFVNAAVYGAAIELLAYQSHHYKGGGVQLVDLEGMYSQALQRFPGNFAEYHLSPEAIVPNRGQPVTIKGIPTSLLQGITTARLLLGDWRNAYLALDTVLRLFPIQVPERFFEVFIFERPLAEAYKVFMVACRSGVIVKPNRLTVILHHLVESQAHLRVADKLLALEGMLNAIHAYVGVGGSIGGHHISALIKGFESLLPAVPMVDFAPDHGYGKGRPAPPPNNLAVANVAREAVLDLALAGVPPTLSTFAGLIGVAGKARSPELLGLAIQDIEAAGLEPNQIVRRSMLLAAGQIGHKELLQEIWRSLVEDAELTGTPLSTKDWQALARAARYEGDSGFVEEQTAALSHTITDAVSLVIEKELSKKQSRHNTTEFITKENAIPEDGLSRIKAKVNEILSAMNSKGLRNFYKDPLPMSLVPPPSLGSEDALRTVYDELTTDPRQPASSESGQPAMHNPAGYPLDKLRFENWKAINELMADAECFEVNKHKLLEKLGEDGMSNLSHTARQLQELYFPVLDPRWILDGKKESRSKDLKREEAESQTNESSQNTVRQCIHRLRAIQTPPAAI